jgi:hypothetical protein
MFKHDTLDDLNDNELQGIIDYAGNLLKRRDGERKAKALDDAKAILAAAGIGFKDLGRKVNRVAKRRPAPGRPKKSAIDK